MIAFFGMGLLGSNFVQALLKRGETVHVWNRTHARATALEQYGAVAYEDPAEAVRGADRLHLTLSDDSAVDEVLERARAGLSDATIIVDHTTTSPAGALERTGRWAERGIRFQHAPVFMGPQSALDATGMMLVSGDRTLYETLKPALETMTGKLVYFGERPGRAAAMKLLGNQFLIAMTAGLIDTLSLSEAMDVPRDQLAELFDTFNPGASVPARLRRITDADYDDPSWTLEMARKDVRLMLEAAGDRDLPVMHAIADLMDRCISDGDAAKDWTVIGKEAVRGT